MIKQWTVKGAVTLVAGLWTASCVHLPFRERAAFRLAEYLEIHREVPRSDRAREAAVRDRGVSAVATFWPSEFTQVRGQYRRSRFGDGPAANEFLFQTLFTIGAHGAHPF